MNNQHCKLDLRTLSAQFWQDGYIVIENFFDTKLMKQCQEAIIGHFGLTPEFLHDEKFLEASKTEVIPWFPQHEGVELFDRVEQLDALQDLSLIHI